MDHARVLSAWCELRQDFRAFRTDRIVTIRLLDRYPGRRADLARRLRAHFEGRSSRQVS
jgi:predicted DNA-binding transcriptional regulator YafY